MKKLFAIAIILLSFHLMVSCSELFVSNCDNDINKNNAYHDQENNDLGGEANEIIDDSTNKVLDKKDEDEIGSLIGATTPEDGDHNNKNDQSSGDQANNEDSAPSDKEESAQDYPEIPTDIKFVTTFSGKYIYSDQAYMGVVLPNGVRYDVKSASEIGLINRVISTSKYHREDVVENLTFNMFDEDISLEYMNSYICDGDVCEAIRKYENVNQYKGRERTMYKFSSATNQLIYYYDPDIESNGRISEEEALSIGITFIESQLGEGYLSHYSRSSSGPYDGKYSFTFTRELCGFPTTDQVKVVVAFSGELVMYRINHLGLYDQFEDTFTVADVENTCNELLFALYDAGINVPGGGYASFVLNDDGILYMALHCSNGRSYYTELEKIG